MPSRPPSESCPSRSCRLLAGLDQRASFSSSAGTQQLQRVAEVDAVTLVAGNLQLFDRAHVFAQEPHAVFGSERKIGGEYYVIGTEEIEAAAQPRRGAADDGVSVEAAEVVDRPQPFRRHARSNGAITRVGAALAELVPHRA